VKLALPKAEANALQFRVLVRERDEFRRSVGRESRVVRQIDGDRPNKTLQKRPRDTRLRAKHVHPASGPLLQRSAKPGPRGTPRF
jgi:hypothetical protein